MDEWAASAKTKKVRQLALADLYEFWWEVQVSNL